MVEEIKEVIGNEIKTETKEKLSKIWRNTIIFLFIYSAFSTVIFVNSLRSRSDIASQLLTTTEQLKRTEELGKELDAEIQQLKSDLLRAGADIARLESDNTELKHLTATGIGENSGARADTIQLTNLGDDSRRLIEESLKILTTTSDSKYTP